MFSFIYRAKPYVVAVLLPALLLLSFTALCAHCLGSSSEQVASTTPLHACCPSTHEHVDHTKSDSKVSHDSRQTESCGCSGNSCSDQIADANIIVDNAVLYPTQDNRFTATQWLEFSAAWLVILNRIVVSDQQPQWPSVILAADSQQSLATQAYRILRI